ncbi:MAG: phosphatase [Oleiphilus sp.]|nr:MAG: phosphatase [Oleiphilus sp.]
MNYSPYDLHCHSNMSDGALPPAEVVARAKANGVEVLALTDHDTVAGIEEAQFEARTQGISLIPGIELSCQWQGHTVHVLGLNFKMDARIADIQARQTRTRMDRARTISHRLEKKGLPEVYSRACALARSGIPGRPHFAQALVESGRLKNQQEAFKKYLGSGKVGDVKAGWPQLAEVVEWILASEGVAVIAHPRKYSMSLTKLRQMIEEFRDAGGIGLEVVVSGQKQGETGMLADLCMRYGMCASVGSDFHSTDFLWADLGRVPVLPARLTPVWECWA